MAFYCQMGFLSWITKPGCSKGDIVLAWATEDQKTVTKQSHLPLCSWTLKTGWKKPRPLGVETVAGEWSNRATHARVFSQMWINWRALGIQTKITWDSNAQGTTKRLLSWNMMTPKLYPGSEVRSLEQGTQPHPLLPCGPVGASTMAEGSSSV